MQTHESRLLEQNSYVHALGLHWHPTSDTFHFTFEQPTSHSITKRTILSLIAKLYDPLGLLAPVIIRAKILMQELWTLKVGWDDPLPCHIANRWMTYMQEFKEINLIKIPRWIGVKEKYQRQLHGFCDASQQAYSALVYARSINSEGSITTRLVVSKTKVAPLKRLTIPRLELAGAVLLIKLMSHIVQVLEAFETPMFLWTDSSITLTWINGHPSKWKDFIQNRVVYIQETLPQATWKFISGKENPADLSTRGLTPAQLITHTEWWEGPEWLSQTMDLWPNKSSTNVITDELELRPVQISTLTSSPIQQPWDLSTRYSTLTKLLRITATCMRAIAIFKHSSNKLTGPLTVSEIDKARKFWIKNTQQLAFKQDINILSRNMPVSKSSSLQRLTPFLDNEGLLRSGGRLQNSSLPEESKHLLILPRQSGLTTLIIADAHTKTLHGGTQLTLTYIRQNYWIIGGRSPVKSFIFKCVICTRYRQRRAQQIMGQLPLKRVIQTIRPFLNTGVDYAGPFFIKTWRGKNARQYKAYIAVFVCLSTSAAHLELVTDYSTEAFIAAYKRFAARRGICSTLSSDCGTNFIGADKQKLFSSSSEDLKRLATLLANDGTEWSFNPPSAPHFGGIWEAAVKSAKYHLNRVVGSHLLTYEEMTTFLTQIEAVLNSRLLCNISDDPEDLTALTPGHFLIGNAPTVIPEPSLEDVPNSRLSRWQLLRQLLDHFWSRWSKECLQRYHDVAKWNRQLPSLAKDSLVLVTDERYPPSKWPLGRIVEVHPGKDGSTRVVTVRTQTSVFKRPIVKLCPLPID